MTKTATKEQTALDLNEAPPAQLPAKASRRQSTVEVMQPVSDDPMIVLYERALRDQTISLERLKELGGLIQLSRQAQAERDFDEAMAACQAEMEPIQANAKNTQTNSKYANQFALDAVRKVYTKHGFSVTFNTGKASADILPLIALVRRGGVERTYGIDIPADGKGAKGGDVMTKTHATVSAVTYGKKTLLAMIFNVAIFGVKDDDGNAASVEPITEEQHEEIMALIVATGADVGRLCALMKIDPAVPYPLKQLTSKNFPRALKEMKDLKRYQEQEAAKKAKGK